MGRFHTQDRYAEKYLELTPYQYGANNPIFYIDINGDSIVSITRSNNQILIENSPLTEGGKNFTNTINLRSGVSQDHVTDQSAGVVNDAMVAIEDTEVDVSSGYRSPEKQAEVMYDNIESNGTESQYKLYGKSGDKIIDKYVSLKSKGDANNVYSKEATVEGMVSEINKVGPGKVSAHSNDPKSYNVFDIAPSSVSNIKSFQKALGGDKRVTKLIKYPKDPAIHVEIKQK